MDLSQFTQAQIVYNVFGLVLFFGALIMFVTHSSAKEQDKRDKIAQAKFDSLPIYKQNEIIAQVKKERAEQEVKDQKDFEFTLYAFIWLNIIDNDTKR